MSLQTFEYEIVDMKDGKVFDYARLLAQYMCKARNLEFRGVWVSAFFSTPSVLSTRTVTVFGKATA
jgi:hypothetical protein